MSYFAKPNYIIYDEWFDDNLEKTKEYILNKKIKNISNIHEFFYDQSNYKVGASENNFQLKVKVNEKKTFTNNYFKKNSGKYTSVSTKKLRVFKKLNKIIMDFNIRKKIIYSFFILGFIFIFGFKLFFISQSKNNESNIINKSLYLEKEFEFSKRIC